MKKIETEGRRTFRATCETCGCKFSYQIEDLEHVGGSSLICPQCGGWIIHRDQDRWFLP